MEQLYHLVRLPLELKAGREYCPESLETEGFVHLCLNEQIAWVANAFLNDAGVLWALELDSEFLESEVKFEEAGSDGQFPHLYGPIPHQAISRQMPLQRDAALRWSLPPQVKHPIVEPFKPLS